MNIETIVDTILCVNTPVSKDSEAWQSLFLAASTENRIPVLIKQKLARQDILINFCASLNVLRLFLVSLSHAHSSCEAQGEFSSCMAAAAAAASAPLPPLLAHERSPETPEEARLLVSLSRLDRSLALYTGACRVCGAVVAAAAAAVGGKQSAVGALFASTDSTMEIVTPEKLLSGMSSAAGLLQLRGSYSLAAASAYFYFATTLIQAFPPAATLLFPAPAQPPLRAAVGLAIRALAQLTPTANDAANWRNDEENVQKGRAGRALALIGVVTRRIVGSTPEKGCTMPGSVYGAAMVFLVTLLTIPPMKFITEAEAGNPDLGQDENSGSEIGVSPSVSPQKSPSNSSGDVWAAAICSPSTPATLFPDIRPPLSLIEHLSSPFTHPAYGALILTLSRSWPALSLALGTRGIVAPLLQRALTDTVHFTKTPNLPHAAAFTASAMLTLRALVDTPAAADALGNAARASDAAAAAAAVISTATSQTSGDWLAAGELACDVLLLLITRLGSVSTPYVVAALVSALGSFTDQSMFSTQPPAPLTPPSSLRPIPFRSGPTSGPRGTLAGQVLTLTAICLTRLVAAARAGQVVGPVVVALSGWAETVAALATQGVNNDYEAVRSMLVECWRLRERNDIENAMKSWANEEALARKLVSARAASATLWIGDSVSLPLLHEMLVTN